MEAMIWKISLSMFGWCALTYRNFAARTGWPVGAWFSRDWYMLFGMICVFWAALTVLLDSMSVSALWKIPLVLVGGYFFSYALTSVARAATQMIAFISCIVCLVAVSTFARGQ